MILKQPSRVVVGLLLLITIWFVGVVYLEPTYFRFDDNVHFHLPAYVHNWRSLVEAGQLAQINFYQHLGNSHLSQGQTAVLYPPVYLVMAYVSWFSTNLSKAIELTIWLHWGISAIGSYLVLRLYRVRSWLAVLVAWLSLSFPFVWSTSRSWLVVVYLWAWFPWIWLTTQVYWQKSSPGNYLLALLPRWLLLVSGYVQWYVMALVVEALWLGLMPAKALKTSLVDRFKVWLSWQLWVGIWAAPILLPLYANVHRSAARQLEMNYQEFISHSVSLPDFLLAQVGRFVPNSPFMSDSHILYLGLPLLVVLVWGLLLRATNKQLQMLIRRFIMLAVLVLLCSTSVYGLAYVVPGLNLFRWPFKYYALVIMLACWSLGLVLEVLMRQKRQIGVVIILSLILAGNGYIWWQQRQTGAFSQQWGNLVSAPAWIEDLDSHYRVITLGPIRSVADQSQYLRFNYPTYYRKFGFGGYDATISEQNQILTQGINPQGHFGPLSQATLDYWASWGVRYLIVAKDYTYQQDLADYAELELISENQFVWLYNLSTAQPLVSYRQDIDTQIDWIEQGNQIVVESDSDRYQGLVFRFAPLDGFSIAINGQNVPWYTNEFQQIEVQVPRGEHLVTLQYRDRWFEVGAGISLVGLIGGCFMLYKRRAVSHFS